MYLQVIVLFKKRTVTQKVLLTFIEIILLIKLVASNIKDIYDIECLSISWEQARHHNIPTDLHVFTLLSIHQTTLFLPCKVS